MARILIVESSSETRQAQAALLEKDEHAVTEAAGAVEAGALLASLPFDLVITAQQLSDGSGAVVLAASQDADPALPVVFTSATATVEMAVDAMRQGAFDFLSLPVNSAALRSLVAHAAEHNELSRQTRLLRGEADRLGFSADLLGESPVMQQVKERIALVAPTGATVLICGETGTGKELAARAIHKGSPRTRGAFLAVNCAAFPETLLDGELFGHEKGAFTGADRSRPGWFEAADRGTLFLDEAGEMSLPLQAKLLRVITDHEIFRVGSRVARRVDVRLILATHRDLKQRVQSGEFREDLYYRVAVVPLDMPPLFQRPQDIPLLVEKFLTDASRELKVPRRGLAPAALQKLQRYRFPGNIRELRNLIERACILGRGNTLGPADFPLGEEAEAESDPIRNCARAMPPSLDLRESVERFEKELILRALEEAEGVQAEAARRLNISRGDVGYKLRKYAVQSPDSPEPPP
ncbi:MAG TPA: sigma-54 dependent transcriptional regulator [Tepidisphaeraceae bacterium]|jgi:DNA-binding NtrC family response regulator|nr:sigma-54 dependent transcriptional regulator [Tepidisphaeraceae bacterium]